ncbi:MAG TPA: hypothetical protein ENJ95_11785 [Bacteroidetes bacterium]|nr:hypothetical protein [Bacteroidota bacterium]
MVLGAKEANPYTVANMTQAWNKLYDPDYQELPTTHLYVRFLPKDMAELKILYDLEDSYDIDYDDYPLDYEIIEDGDHYHDPSIPQDQPTWLYTVVEPDFVFPNVQYEILDKLVLAPYYSILTVEAYRLTGKEYDIEGWGDGPAAGGGGDPQSGECTPSCGNYPCCLLKEVPCDDEDPCKDPPCVPGSPTWPECLEVPDDPEPPTFTLNECGCRVSSNPRYPAGCVQVVDTQIDPEPGVREVKVIVKNTPFTRRTTYTDEKGCWEINKRHKGKIRVKVKFKNGICKIRAIRRWSTSLWQYGKVLTDKTVYHSPPYNNLHRLYEQNADDHSKGRAFWYAATGNNALFEYIGFAASDGIAAPPKLDILLTLADEDEASPMLGRISTGVWGQIIIAAFILVFFGLTGPFGAAMAIYISVFAPDMVYNHGGEGNRASDLVKETFYHEFAHASHYNALNDDLYWIQNIAYIVDNNGYGDGTANGAGPTAVIEMWGYHYGPVLADRQYGLLHSLNTGSPAFQNITRHIYGLEGFVPILPPTTSAAWIPQGVFLDCIDNNASNPTGVVDGIPTDPVTGFSHADCFNAITGSPTDPTTVRNNLTTNSLPLGQTIPAVNALFALYGF